MPAILLRDLGLLDSRWSLIVTYTAIGLPSAVFIMAGFLRTLPSELEEDGLQVEVELDQAAAVTPSRMRPVSRPTRSAARRIHRPRVWGDTQRSGSVTRSLRHASSASCTECTTIAPGTSSPADRPNAADGPGRRRLVFRTQTLRG